MTPQEVQALADAAQGLILFHNGLWGAPVCYMWAGPDGEAAGRVPLWEADALDRLGWRGLAIVSSDTGTADVPVVATEAGLRVLSALTPAMKAA